MTFGMRWRTEATLGALAERGYIGIACGDGSRIEGG
jgi:hypothetical protein